MVFLKPSKKTMSKPSRSSRIVKAPMSICPMDDTADEMYQNYKAEEDCYNLKYSPRRMNVLLSRKKIQVEITAQVSMYKAIYERITLLRPNSITYIKPVSLTNCCCCCLKRRFVSRRCHFVAIIIGWRCSSWVLKQPHEKLDIVIDQHEWIKNIWCDALLQDVLFPSSIITVSFVLELRSYATVKTASPKMCSFCNQYECIEHYWCCWSYILFREVCNFVAEIICWLVVLEFSNSVNVEANSSKMSSCFNQHECIRKYSYFLKRRSVSKSIPFYCRYQRSIFCCLDP